MKRLVRVLLGICIAIALCTLFAYFGLRWLARSGMPQLEGEVHLAGMEKGATVTRDKWGIPHIEAESQHDAYFALGYSMAQERLFQIEMMRRLSQGELSEIVGSIALDIDKAMRILRLRPKADENAALLRERFPEEFAASEAFLKGVNEYAQNGPTPFEFTVMGIPRHTYTLTDSLCIAGILPITFSYGPRQDAMYSIVQQKFPDLDVSLLFPGYSQEIPTTVMETREEAEALLRERGMWPPKSAPAPQQQVAVLQPFIEQWQKVADLLGNHLGSNSWVLGPSRTTSGGALLANDPHIGFTNPSIWYEAHVTYDGFDLYGYYLPLIPIALLGHNRDIGWGLTMFANDDVDLYAEKREPNNPNRVMYKGEWTDLKTERETIKVRFGDDVEHEVQVSPHGPIITPLLEKYEGYSGAPVALYWVWQHVDYTDIAAFYRMARAHNYDAFAEAVKLCTSPGVNVSYADREGNIAWWAAGKLPIRPAHVNSKALLDGASGNDDPLGFLPFEQNPHLKNPPNGYIVTANNKSSVREFGPIASLTGYWQPWDRAERIESQLDTREKWSIDDTKRLQTDGVGVTAKEIIGAVTKVLESEKEKLSTTEYELVTRLTEWDGNHDSTSNMPTVYTYLCDAILDRTVADELGPDNFKVYAGLGEAWCFLHYVVQREDSPFWDDRTTSDHAETRAEIFVSAMRLAIAKMTEKHGSNPGDWRWGKDHTMTFMHPLGFIPVIGGMFNIGPFDAPGGAQTINNLLHPHGTFDHKIIAGPSTRRIIDFADVEHSNTILPTGNSGHWLDPHYADQAEMFIKGEYREVMLTKEQIEKNTARTLRLSAK